MNVPEKTPLTPHKRSALGDWLFWGAMGAIVTGLIIWGAIHVITRPEPTPPPTTRFLFQPELHWADGTTTLQGTGFIARTAGGEIVMVTSVHFMDRDGPALQEMVWTDMNSGDPVVRSKHSWGDPGRVDDDAFLSDYSNDFVVMPIDDGEVAASDAVELDTRNRVGEGEIVWMPNKSELAPSGYSWHRGRVTDATEEMIVIKVFDTIEMGSQSGTPIFSGKTGRVVGILSGSFDSYGRGTELVIAPIRNAHKALESRGERKPLREVIGRPVAPSRPR